MRALSDGGDGGQGICGDRYPPGEPPGAAGVPLGRPGDPDAGGSQRAVSWMSRFAALETESLRMSSGRRRAWR